MRVNQRQNVQQSVLGFKRQGHARIVGDRQTLAGLDGTKLRPLRGPRSIR